MVRSQTVTVIDQETGEPLILATIMGQGTQKFATTNESGQADLSNFQEHDTLRIRQLGYQEESWTLRQLRKHSFVVRLFQATLSLDGILITATRIQQDAREVPYKVSTLGQDHAYLQNPQSAADLLGSSGKIFIQKSQQGGGSPMIRGFATNRLLYTVDGVRMNTAIFRSGNLQNVISLDPFAIEKTDIYFGPGSIIYGSDAIGGVMSFKTLTPEFSSRQKNRIQGRVNVRHATANNEKTGHLHLNLGLDKWAFLSSATISDYDDLKMGSKGPMEYLRLLYVDRINGEDIILQNKDVNIQIPSGYTQLNLMQKIRFEPDENWTFNYVFHFSTTSGYSR
jgi:hemoglobin/transferrin/lactoferrin receptor protein